jgi:hypothetical protein
MLIGSARYLLGVGTRRRGRSLELSVGVTMDETTQEKKNGMGGPAGGHTEGRKGGPVRNGEITRRGGQ